MAGLSRKEIARLVDHVTPQGVEVTRASEGLLLRLPNHDRVWVHFTSSDVHFRKSLRARLKKAGISMPTDRSEAAQLAPYITSVTPTRHSRERAQQTLDRLGLPRVTTTQLVNAGGAPNVVQASQVLYALGWLPSKTQRNAKRYWVPPVESDPEPAWTAPLTQLPEPHPAVPAPEPEVPAPEPEVPAEPEPAPEPEPEVPAADEPEHAAQAQAPAWVSGAPGGWGVRWADLPEEWTVAQLQVMLLALGLDGELRLWRS